MDLIRYAPHLAVFVEVARARSFSAVARARGVAASSIVRQVDALEAAIGARLLVRTTRALSTTDAGEVMLQRASDILRRLADAQAEVAALEQGPRGVLRLSCVPTFARYYVVPLILELAAEHPDLRIALDLSEGVPDPQADRLDACIRIGDLQDSAQVAVRIATQRWVLCASPSYIAAAGPVTHLADLRRHRRIDKRRDPGSLGWPRLLGEGPLRWDEEGVFLCDDFDTLRVATLAGLGVAFLPTWVVGQDIKAGRLLHLLDDPTREERGIHVVRAVPSAPAKLRLFIDRLRRHIGTPPVWDYATWSGQREADAAEPMAG